jgi:Mrp family chromosome partitioning ATPase
MIGLLEELGRRFDMVLVDTPALSAVTDAAILAPLVDGVLMVVSCGSAQQDNVKAACQQLTGVGGKLTGVIVNRTRQIGHYYYYEPQPGPGIGWAFTHRIVQAALPKSTGRLLGKMKVHPQWS